MRTRFSNELGFRPSSVQRGLIYLFASSLLLTGAGWLWMEHFVRIQTEFGPEHHSSQRALLTVHGVLGMAAVWGFGAVWSAHARHAWNLGRHRVSGGVVIVTMALLTLSGLLLYYAGNDALRSWSSAVHWGIGAAGGVGLLVHGFVARKPRRLLADASSSQ